jgi:hypothetical protein
MLCFDGVGRFTLAAGAPTRSLYTNLLLKGLQDSMMARVRTGCDKMAPTDRWIMQSEPRVRCAA